MQGNQTMATRQRPTAKLHLLTARQVMAAKDGDHSDGGGLLLRVRAASAAWVFRYTAPSGRRREMGLGAARRGSAEQAGATLTAARDLAHQAREHLRAGVDPIDKRDAKRDDAKQADEAKRAAKARERWTLARAARDYHERVIELSRTTKHAAQWIASLENHVPPLLWHAPIESIEPAALLAGLLGIRSLEDEHQAVPETTQRVRQRLDAVFEDAIFHKRCRSNPAAAIRRKMREGQPRRERGAFKALPYREAPALMARIREQPGLAARCLELTVLTAARTSESLMAEWSEFDLDEGLWRVPAARMKAREPHTVFLPARAVELLRELQGLDRRFVFPSPTATDEPQPLSNMAMLAVLKRLSVRGLTTVHGLARATFSTWANENGVARPDVIETCLAHEEGDRVRKAYNRASFNDERRKLLADWAEYLARPAAQILPLRAA